MKNIIPLDSFDSGGVAVVVGSGGIGSALVDRLAASRRFQRIVVGCRSPGDTARRVGTQQTTPVETVRLDLLQESTMEGLAARLQDLGRPLRLVICATGTLHRGEELQPERRVEDLAPARLAEVFAVNSFGPALVAKHLVSHIPRRERSVFAAISARVGSIGDNRLGGWYAYRASKAALNQMLRCLAIELRRRAPGAIVAALHPGTVETALSAPFRSGVPETRLFSPDDSASRLLSVIDGLEQDDSGGFFAWDGSTIPW